MSSSPRYPPCFADGFLVGSLCSDKVLLLLRLQARKEHEEELRRKRKYMDRFDDLLVDYFYRDDHLAITWDEVRMPCCCVLLSRRVEQAASAACVFGRCVQACDMLRDRSAYKDLDRVTRKELFDKHMTALRAEAERVKASSVDAAAGAAPLESAAPPKAAGEVEEGELSEDKPRTRSTKDRSRSPKSRKKSSSKKSKKRRESSSSPSSGSSSSESDDDRHHKSKKRKESKRHRKD
jgi:hypothetical protein